jgi:putative membrane protein
VAKKVVIAIDRDDDLGQKVGIVSPVIGRENVLQAAVRLVLADPEDSDANAMFSAIKIYDELVEKGEECEVVVVTGDKNVGKVSDTKIAQQLDSILVNLNPESVIVVTDGSEDEFVMPLVYSRFKVDLLNRVVVKQSKTLESTYFLLRRMFNEPKVARVTLAPIGIIFLVYSFFLLIQHPEWGIGGIILFLGLYFVGKAYGLDKSLAGFLEGVRKSVSEGRLSFIFYLGSGILMLIGFAVGFNASIAHTIPHIAVATFIFYSISWITLSAVAIAIARAIDAFSEDRRVGRYFTSAFIAISIGLIIWGTAGYIINPEIRDSIYRFAATVFAALFVSAIGLLFTKMGAQKA